ncbi:DUF317 domain-containing protein [Kitasatospora cystarginea]|uniref:DUF317 domain-containing protein n=1 Tax=Kitasatospora cystarginea TaxID=58350 RepID=UPI0031D54CFB
MSPGFLAGPGDLASGDAAFADFLIEHRSWARYACDGGDTSVAISDCLTGRIQLDYEPGVSHTRWTVAGYDSPVGELAWHARFDLGTPHEIPLAVASAYSHALSYGSQAVRDEALWGRRSTRVELVDQMRECGWQDVSTLDGMAFRAPDATAGLIRWDGGAFYDEPDGQDHMAEVTLWVRHPEEFPHTAWTAQLSKAMPTRLIAVALDHLTDPQPAIRRRAEIPTAHRPAFRVIQRPGVTNTGPDLRGHG